MIFSPCRVAPSPFRGQFPLEAGLSYLNHAGVAPIPLRAVTVVREMLEEMSRFGALRYPKLDAWRDRARDRAAALLGTGRDRIAFLSSTSEGLSFVGLGLDWRPGDEVVTTDQEFPSNALIWRDLARRFGIRVVQATSEADGAVSTAALLDRVGSRTRVVAISSVQYATGAVVDLAHLGAALRDTPVLLVVDAIQSLGLLPLQAEALGLDAVAADGHKWLLGPEGCALFHLSAKAQSVVAPRVLGWHSPRNAGRYDEEIAGEWQPDLRRFEAGSPNLLGIAALAESMGLLLEVGIGEVASRVSGLMARLTEGLRGLGCRFHTPLDDQGLPGAGILVWSHPNRDADALHRALMAKGIYCARRGKGVRFSPHFYLDDRDIDGVLQVVADLLSES
ncbi:MAG: aminotransferase class V-fold PLP-dependent enzyme [Magnetococcales bacterium]|nr:aminotransferase class V-fold PLP-dependent enzyme [Magnetococcales bacterium]